MEHLDIISACLGSEEYDCETSVDTSDKLREMLIGTFNCIDYTLYDKMDFQHVWTGPADPRNYIADREKWPMAGYNSANAEGMKWVACNIFNISEADYDRLSAGFENLESSGDGKLDVCYYENGRYYIGIGGIGWEILYDYVMKSVQTDGEYYYITYHRDWSQFDNSGETTYYTYIAKMALKEIDGKKYWSIYSNHKVE